MIALTIALGASLATAMLSVMFDVGDKVNQELKTYGANIKVVSKSASVLDNLYELEGEEGHSAGLREDELGKIKTIFWAFNIVDYAPFVEADVTLDGGQNAKVVGTWFNHHMDLPTGETLDTGVKDLRTWWDITDGAWLDEQAEGGQDGCMVGAALAEQYEAVLPFLEKRSLEEWTHNKAIQKSVESFRIRPEQKAYLKSLRAPARGKEKGTV